MHSIVDPLAAQSLGIEIVVAVVSVHARTFGGPAEIVVSEHAAAFAWPSAASSSAKASSRRFMAQAPSPVSIATAEEPPEFVSMVIPMTAYCPEVLV